MTAPKVQILVGMIASGKSTYSRQAACKGLIIVNDDAIVSAVHADEYQLYAKALKPLYKAVENTIAGIAIALGRSVVIDRGVNLSRRSRARWLAIADSLDVPCECILFPVHSPLSHAQRRYKHDHRGHSLAYWQKVASHHLSVYDEPSLDEGFSSIADVNYNDLIQYLVAGGIPT